MNQKLISGKFWMVVASCMCLVSLTATICAVIYNNPTGELNGAVMMALGAIITTIATVTTSYFRKKEDV